MHGGGSPKDGFLASTTAQAHERDGGAHARGGDERNSEPIETPAVKIERAYYGQAREKEASRPSRNDEERQYHFILNDGVQPLRAGRLAGSICWRSFWVRLLQTASKDFRQQRPDRKEQLAAPAPKNDLPSKRTHLHQAERRRPHCPSKKTGQSGGS